MEAPGHARLDAAQIRELMGTVPNAVFERIIEAVNGNNSAEVMTAANQLLDAGNSPAQLARQCVRYLRNALIAKIAGLSPEGESARRRQRAPANLPRRAAPRRPHRRPLQRRRAHPLPAGHAAHLRRTGLPTRAALPLRAWPAQARPPAPPAAHRRGPQPAPSPKVAGCLHRFARRFAGCPIHAGVSSRHGWVAFRRASVPCTRSPRLLAIRAGQAPPPSRIRRAHPHRRRRRRAAHPEIRGATAVSVASPRPRPARLKPSRSRARAGNSRSMPLPMPSPLEERIEQQPDVALPRVFTQRQPFRRTATVPVRTSPAPDRRQRAVVEALAAANSNLRRRRHGRRRSGPSPTAKPACKPALQDHAPRRHESRGGKDRPRQPCAMPASTSSPCCPARRARRRKKAAPRPHRLGPGPRPRASHGPAGAKALPRRGPNRHRPPRMTD
jgi:hypothetical protein